MVKITIDKEYYFKSLDEMSVEEYIDITASGLTDSEIISKMIGCEKKILELIPPMEFDKLIILAKHILSQKITAVGINIPFAPLGSYPFGVFADFKSAITRFDGDTRMIPYTIALLRPGVGYELRTTYWLDWAKSLPASIGIYYHNKIMNEYLALCGQFKALEGDPPDDNELKAGIEHLAKYGEYLTIHRLTAGNILNLKDVSLLPTNQVLTYLCAGNDIGTYTKELARLRKPQ